MNAKAHAKYCSQALVQTFHPKRKSLFYTFHLSILVTCHLMLFALRHFVSKLTLVDVELFDYAAPR